MSEHKRGETDLVGKPDQSEHTEKEPLRPEATMHTDAQLRKPGGRLSREDQRRLGDILQRVYDDVISQGVPDRFRDLLNELDELRPKEAGQDTNVVRRAEKETKPDHLRGPESEHNPSNKGSN